jgi:hypothetical protein
LGGVGVEGGVEGEGWEAQRVAWGRGLGMEGERRFLGLEGEVRFLGLERGVREAQEPAEREGEYAVEKRFAHQGVSPRGVWLRRVGCRRRPREGQARVVPWRWRRVGGRFVGCEGRGGGGLRSPLGSFMLRVAARIAVGQRRLLSPVWVVGARFLILRASVVLALGACVG